MKKLIYGSGKLFFRRVWMRLHSENERLPAIRVVRDAVDDDEEEDSKPAAVSAAAPKPGAKPVPASEPDVKISADPAAKPSSPKNDVESKKRQDMPARSRSSSSSSSSSPSPAKQNKSDDDGSYASSSDGSELAPTHRRNKTSTSSPVQKKQKTSE